MYWDRFDICAAYYHFVCLTIVRSKHYSLDEIIRYQLGVYMQLHRLRYKPGLSDSKLSNISDNAKAIYMGLIRKHLGVYSAAKH